MKERTKNVLGMVATVLIATVELLILLTAVIPLIEYIVLGRLFNLSKLIVIIFKLKYTIEYTSSPFDMIFYPEFNYLVLLGMGGDEHEEIHNKLKYKYLKYK